ncbi:hypothetical protein [Evansella clarkii]|uniref:hypothetical protein n=1 Tax=Evansella clarkii TaxID=79879 RepID=UPI0009973012|nr:hypothetical protein [Evansella clarkii]
MANQQEIIKALEKVRSIKRSLAIITAILLLTGQITIIGVFVTPRGFRASLGGPITGQQRLVSKTGNPLVNLTIDLIDIFIAKFLITGQFSVTGVVLNPAGLSINVGGPLLGLPHLRPTLPGLEDPHDNIYKLLCEHLNLNPKLIENHIRE